MIGHVGIMRRCNSDGSITYYIRWFSRHAEGRRTNRRRRVGRTACNPTHREKRQWENRARLAAAEAEDQLVKGDDMAQRSLHPSEAVDDYLNYCQGLWAVQTIRRRESVLVPLSTWLITHGVPRTYQLRQAHLDAWRTEQAERLQASSLITACAAVQGWLEWLGERGLPRVRLHAISARERRQLNPPPPDRVFLGTEQLRSLIEKAETLIGAAIVTLAGTGLRIGEYEAVVLNWWDAKGRVLTIDMPSSRTKRHHRQVPVGEYVGAMIDRFCVLALPGGQLFAAATGATLRRRLDRCLAGQGVTPHDFRRWYSNTLLYYEPPCPDPIRKALLGHVLNARDLAYCDLGDVEKLRPWANRISEALEGGGPS